MNELPSIEDRVSKGICWLEEQGAYDWAEKIVEAADAGQFNMKCGGTCAVGTVLGSFGEAFSYNADDWEDDAQRHGFWMAVPETGTPRTWAKRMDALELAWADRARAHAAYRAEVLG